ncbi:hypothetical protein E1176_04095, partial [Fulvivirga sp. RKSG066]|uniref:hypothetical protein n=1 Tax=Fulvivirga aurantia TaxID=2529383 RepID=UPI0012BD7819
MRALTFLFLLLSSSFLKAQSFQQIAYGVEEGLVTHLVKSAEFDAYGFLWIGTDEGLVRYDGRSFQNYAEATPSRYIKKVIAYDDDLYAVSDLGITKILAGVDTVGFETIIKGSRSKVDSLIWFPKDLYKDSEGVFWVPEPGSIVRLHQGRVERFEFPDHDTSISFFRSFSIFEVNGLVHTISHTGRLYRFDYDQNAFTLVSDEFTNEINGVNVVYPYDQNNVIIGCLSGLYKVKIEPDGMSIEKQQLYINEVSSIIAYQGQILVGNYGKSLLFLDQDLNIQKRVNVFKTNDITHTPEGNIWISSDEGMVLLKKNYFHTINEEPHYIESILPQDENIYYCFK